MSAEAAGVDPAFGGCGEDAVGGVGVEVVAQQVAERFGAWVAGLWDDREGHCLAEECFPVELLFSVDLGVVVIGGEEFVQIFMDAEAGASVVVVDAVVGQEIFEVAALRGFIFVAAERDEDHPGVGIEDAAEFCEGTRDVEPMKGTAGGDHGDGCVGESGGFGRAVADVKAWPGSEELLAG